MNLLITGAASGIGACLTEQALERGHSVIAADADGRALVARWAGAGNVRCETLDVREEADWQKLFQQLVSEKTAVDVLVNVAGVLRSGRTGQLKGEDVALMLDVNVKGTILGTNAAAAHMLIQGNRGHIVNIGSIASLYATPGTSVYATSKFAVRGFSIAAAGDLRHQGIAVTLVGPGPVKTAMLEQQRGDDNAALTFSGRRALSPEEVAQAVLGPVIKKRPLEFYLPWHEGVLGRLCNLAPGFFLAMARGAAERGRRNFNAEEYR